MSRLFPPLGIAALDTSTASALASYLPLNGSQSMTGALRMEGNAIILGNGDVYSANWDGAIPADLSAGADPAATLGFYLDSSAGVIQATAYEGDTPDVPTGSIMMFGGSAAPAAWVLCDGTSYTTAGQPALFAVIGYTYGGAGANFNVPDLRQRFPLGKAAAGTGSTLGGTGGEIDHDHTLVHTHELDHVHWYEDTGTTSGHSTGLVASGSDVARVTTTGGHTFAVGANTQGADDATTDSQSTNDSGTNNPPYLVINYIIKT